MINKITKPFSLYSSTRKHYKSFCGMQNKEDFIAHSLAWVPLKYCFAHLDYPAIDEINYYNELWG